MRLTVCLAAIAALTSTRIVRAALPSESIFVGILVLLTLVVLFSTGDLE